MREIGFFFDGFRFLTAKQKTFLRENQIFINLLLFLSSMFEYDGFAPEINTDFIEFYNSLTPRACSGIFKKENGKEVLGYATEGGLLDDYGIPSMFNINTLGRSNKQGVVDGENAAICWNNKTHTNDMVQLSRFTELFNLVDTAQKCLIRYARLFPVFEVDNEQVKVQLEGALKNADNGEPFTYVNKGLSKIGLDGEPNMKILQLGDISAVEKIQYLSTYHNDLLRRFFTMYGMSYSQSMKAAQQSIEEIHSDINVSWIIPQDRLRQRQKFVDTYNKVFGHNATVRFSDAWKKAYQKYMEEGGAQDEEMESASITI
jgi:hypothetical protein